MCVGSESDRLLSFLVLLSADLFFFFDLIRPPTSTIFALQPHCTREDVHREKGRKGILIPRCTFGSCLLFFYLFLPSFSFVLSFCRCVRVCVCVSAQYGRADGRVLPAAQHSAVRCRQQQRRARTSDASTHRLSFPFPSPIHAGGAGGGRR